ncbi:MAG: VOC family protein [Oligoflexales bacterium]
MDLTSSITDLRHVGIVTDNIEESIKFYHSLFGYEVRKDQIESGIFLDKTLNLKGIKVRTVKMSRDGSCQIELLHYLSHPREKFFNEACSIGISHLAFTVEDLDNIYNSFSDKGIEFYAPPQPSPDGYARLTFCKAPEGTLIELVELLQ